MPGTTGASRASPLRAGPGLANMRNGAAYIGASGKLVVPAAKTLPRHVPFSKETVRRSARVSGR